MNAANSNSVDMDPSFTLVLEFEKMMFKDLPRHFDCCCSGMRYNSSSTDKTLGILGMSSKGVARMVDKPLRTVSTIRLMVLALRFVINTIHTKQILEYNCKNCTHHEYNRNFQHRRQLSR